MTDNLRYQGRPFLRLLECYVLREIGALSDADRVVLERMEPHLRHIYRREGPWYEIVAAEMGFPKDFPEAIHKNWRENKERAERSGHFLTPEDFSRFLAEHLASSQNFQSRPSAN